jgi:hypothetical protein
LEQEVIPRDYDGVMATDRGRSYDAHICDDIKQQKCLALILRSINDVLATKKGLARNFGEGLQALLQDAMQLWHAFHAREVADFVMEAPQL